MKNRERMLMNPQSGSVETEKDWRIDASYNGWTFDADELIEVVRNADGEWTDVQDLEA